MEQCNEILETILLGLVIIAQVVRAVGEYKCNGPLDQNLEKW